MIEFLPWWIFVVPVMVLGALAAVAKYEIPYFSMGFLSGAVVWIVSNLYFNFIYGGYLIHRIGTGLGALALGGAGLIGGLLTGLAFYTGKSIVGSEEKKLNL
jgi:hypothetical protein